jgi:hypothetical protein
VGNNSRFGGELKKKMADRGGNGYILKHRPAASGAPVAMRQRGAIHSRARSVRQGVKWGADRRAGAEWHGSHAVTTGTRDPAEREKVGADTWARQRFEFLTPKQNCTEFDLIQKLGFKLEKNPGKFMGTDFEVMNNFGY